MSEGRNCIGGWVVTILVALFAMALLVPTLVWRIMVEERLLNANTRYSKYCAATRWRLLPGIW